MSGPHVHLSKIWKGFREGERDRIVLRDVSLAVAPGEWLILLGRSGSGKSTLLNLISGIDLPDKGEVEVAGVRLNRLSERERTLFRRERIGFVFQFYNLVPTLTVIENVLLPLELAGRADPVHRRRGEELLERVGLADRRSAYPELLSGGEQQRVAVVRALANSPQLILADEPTGNLDKETGGQVIDLFGALARPAGVTVILVTHSTELTRFSDRTLLVGGGGIEPWLGEKAP
ncbi:ABC transporter ATP-binding protein [Geobacter sp. DSM 9736]|uniref:ABC transporter ATP-binding protein n=1 Tax=Geobacter sp. DSM 9736 TaxID=1277350 RepID=UPI000B503C9A